MTACGHAFFWTMVGAEIRSRRGVAPSAMVCVRAIALRFVHAGDAARRSSVTAERDCRQQGELNDIALLRTYGTSKDVQLLRLWRKKKGKQDKTGADKVDQKERPQTL